MRILLHSISGIKTIQQSPIANFATDLHGNETDDGAWSGTCELLPGALAAIDGEPDVMRFPILLDSSPLTAQQVAKLTYAGVTSTDTALTAMHKLHKHHKNPFLAPEHCA